jgi:hypothetical protein
MAEFVTFKNGDVVRACGKCGGSGYIAEFAYESEGVCFGCAGRGVKRNAKRFDSIEALKAHEAKLEKARIKREEKRDAQRKAEFEARAAEIAAQPVVEIVEIPEPTYYQAATGEIVDVSGEVRFAFSIGSKYGKQMLVQIQSGTAAVKFFTTAAFAWDLEEGQQVTVRGEISEFSQYQGQKQTIIKKVKLVA